MEEKNMKNQKKFQGLVVMLVFAIIVILGLVGYICYDKGIIFGTRQEKSTDLNKTTNGKDEEKLDINGSFVKSLYMNVESDHRCFNNISLEVGQEMDASDIDYDTKFIMALQIMLDSDKESLECNKYAPTKYFDEPSDNLGCGDNLYDTNTNKFKSHDGVAEYTTLLLEEKVKNRMNQIFGNGTYEQKDLIKYADTWYKYIPEEKGYARLTVPVGGTCAWATNQLISAIKKNNQIILTEKKTGPDDSYHHYYEYTFTYNSDEGSYYLTHIKSGKA